MNGKRLSLAAVMALSLLSLLGLESCSKNNSSSYQTDGTLTATVNGSAYSAKSYVIAALVTTLTPQIIVEGDSITNSDTTRVQVAVPSNFPVNQATSVDSSAYTGAVGISYYSRGVTYLAYAGTYDSHGDINLSSLDTVSHHIAGTFTGVLYATSSDSVVITNGAFNSSYQVP